jgi:diphosphomevalonate decarboxylase
MTSATAVAFPNIAFVKYWGNRDQSLRLPSNGSVSMNLDGLTTRTQVIFDPSLKNDTLILNGRQLTGVAFSRVSLHLERVRRMAGITTFAQVISENNFPTGTGIASSASGFAALTLATTAAAGLQLDESELSRLARTASGSACRSIPAGFVEWQMGSGDLDSYAFSIAPPEHWKLVDCIAIVSQEHKPTSSTEGHALANTSALQRARLEQAPRHLEICRRAILERDFDSLAEIVELDSNMMHAVIMTSTPPILYWEPATIAIMQKVQSWRKSGVPVCYTIDAGPNVHVICQADSADQVFHRIREIPGVRTVLRAIPGDAARLV